MGESDNALTAHVLLNVFFGNSTLILVTLLCHVQPSVLELWNSTTFSYANLVDKNRSCERFLSDLVGALDVRSDAYRRKLNDAEPQCDANDDIFLF